ncbi:MAG: sulfatase-like hydrolase/transferase [Caldilineaceae bacterium]
MIRNTDYGARRTLKPAQQWIGGQSGPWFALVHYLEAHLEYKPPASWAKHTDNWPLAQKLLAADQLRLCYRHITGAERLNEEELRVWGQLYAAEVAYQDHALGRLIDWLRQSGRLDDTLVIVVADHGESLGEQGLLNHLYGLYDPLIHVPLVMRGPGVRRGQRVSGLVQTSDIYGTVLSAAGIATASDRPSLLDEAAQRDFVVSEYGQPRMPRRDLLDRFALQESHFAPYMRSLTAIRTAQHKLITGSDGGVEFYDLIDDAAESTNLAATSAATAEMQRLQTLLHAWQDDARVSAADESSMPVEIDPAVEAQLKALGYLD